MNNLEKWGMRIGIILLAIGLFLCIDSNSKKAKGIENLNKEVTKLQTNLQKSFSLNKTLTTNKADLNVKIVKIKTDLESTILEKTENSKNLTMKLSKLQLLYDNYVEKVTELDESDFNLKFVQYMNSQGACLILTYNDGYTYFDNHSKQLIIELISEISCLRRGLKYEK